MVWQHDKSVRLPSPLYTQRLAGRIVNDGGIATTR
jgi:hypothetical protein